MEKILAALIVALFLLMGWTVVKGINQKTVNKIKYDQYMEQCLNDGKKQYECEALIKIAVYGLGRR